ncbi:hypothetical protein BsWGS_21616 [Bradybaena similaris]
MRGLLLLVTVVIAALSQMCHADSCTYDDCVFENITSRYSGTEVLIVYLNITKIPDDLAEQCAILVDRDAKCEGQKAGCSLELEEDWENRMHDPVYVEFIMRLGTDYCLKYEDLFALRDCFTEELQNAVQSCIYGDYGFDFPCIKEQYSSLENCPDDTDAIFYDIVDNFLVDNPYYTHIK